MAINTNGILPISLPGTFIPGGVDANNNPLFPAALANSIRGGVQVVAGTATDHIGTIDGSMLQDGMLVFVQAAHNPSVLDATNYASFDFSFRAERFYQYRVRSGDATRDANGRVPNTPDNWEELQAGGFQLLPPVAASGETQETIDIEPGRSAWQPAETGDDPAVYANLTNSIITGRHQGNVSVAEPAGLTLLSPGYIDRLVDVDVSVPRTARYLLDDDDLPITSFYTDTIVTSTTITFNTLFDVYPQLTVGNRYVLQFYEIVDGDYVLSDTITGEVGTRNILNATVSFSNIMTFGDTPVSTSPSDIVAGIDRANRAWQVLEETGPSLTPIEFEDRYVLAWDNTAGMWTYQNPGFITWQASATYERDELVAYNGRLYLALEQTTASLPPDMATPNGDLQWTPVATNLTDFPDVDVGQPEIFTDIGPVVDADGDDVTERIEADVSGNFLSTRSSLPGQAYTNVDWVEGTPYIVREFSTASTEPVATYNLRLRFVSQFGSFLFLGFDRQGIFTASLDTNYDIRRASVTESNPYPLSSEDGYGLVWVEDNTVSNNRGTWQPRPVEPALTASNGGTGISIRQDTSGNTIISSDAAQVPTVSSIEELPDVNFDFTNIAPAITDYTANSSLQTAVDALTFTGLFASTKFDAVSLNFSGTDTQRSALQALLPVDTFVAGAENVQFAIRNGVGGDIATTISDPATVWEVTTSALGFGANAWAADTTYAVGDRVYAGTAVYESVIADNIGNDPVSDDTSNWEVFYSGEYVIIVSITTPVSALYDDTLMRSSQIQDQFRGEDGSMWSFYGAAFNSTTSFLTSNTYVDASGTSQTISIDGGDSGARPTLTNGLAAKFDPLREAFPINHEFTQSQAASSEPDWAMRVTSVSDGGDTLQIEGQLLNLSDSQDLSTTYLRTVGTSSGSNISVEADDLLDSVFTATLATDRVTVDQDIFFNATDQEWQNRSSIIVDTTYPTADSVDGRTHVINSNALRAEIDSKQDNLTFVTTGSVDGTPGSGNSRVTLKSYVDSLANAGNGEGSGHRNLLELDDVRALLFAPLAVSLGTLQSGTTASPLSTFNSVSHRLRLQYTGFPVDSVTIRRGDVLGFADDSAAQAEEAAARVVSVQGDATTYVIELDVLSGGGDTGYFALHDGDKEDGQEHVFVVSADAVARVFRPSQTDDAAFIYDASAATLAEFIVRDDRTVTVTDAAQSSSLVTQNYVEDTRALLQTNIDTKEDAITETNRLNANLIGDNGDVSNAEYGYLSGVTSDIQTQLDAKEPTINASNRLSATFIGDNGDVSNTEYGYLAGVTSDIQTQLDAKEPTINASNRLDANLIGDNGDVSNTEYGYLSNVTSDIQAQLDGKEPTINTSNRLNANLIGDNGDVSNTEYGYLSNVTSDIQAQLDARALATQIPAGTTPNNWLDLETDFGVSTTVALGAYTTTAVAGDLEISTGQATEVRRIFSTIIGRGPQAVNIGGVDYTVTIAAGTGLGSSTLVLVIPGSGTTWSPNVPPTGSHNGNIILTEFVESTAIIAGDNVTLTQNANDQIVVSSTGGGDSGPSINYTFDDTSNSDNNILGVNFEVDSSNVVTATVDASDVSGTDTFVGLTDTPSSFGDPGLHVVINSTGDGLEFTTDATLSRIAGPSSFEDPNDGQTYTFSDVPVLDVTTRNGNLQMSAGTPTGGVEGQVRINSDTRVGSGSTNHNLEVFGNLTVHGETTGIVSDVSLTDFDLTFFPHFAASNAQVTAPVNLADATDANPTYQVNAFVNHLYEFTSAGLSVSYSTTTNHLTIDNILLSSISDIRYANHYALLKHGNYNIYLHADANSFAINSAGTGYEIAYDVVAITSQSNRETVSINFLEGIIQDGTAQQVHGLSHAYLASPFTLQDRIQRNAEAATNPVVYEHDPDEPTLIDTTGPTTFGSSTLYQFTSRTGRAISAPGQLRLTGNLRTFNVNDHFREAVFETTLPIAVAGVGTLFVTTVDSDGGVRIDPSTDSNDVITNFSSLGHLQVIRSWNGSLSNTHRTCELRLTNAQALRDLVGVASTVDTVTLDDDTSGGGGGSTFIAIFQPNQTYTFTAGDVLVRQDPADTTSIQYVFSNEEIAADVFSRLPASGDWTYSINSLRHMTDVANVTRTGPVFTIPNYVTNVFSNPLDSTTISVLGGSDDTFTNLRFDREIGGANDGDIRIPFNVPGVDQTTAQNNSHNFIQYIHNIPGNDVPVFARLGDPALPAGLQYLIVFQNKSGFYRIDPTTIGYRISSGISTPDNNGVVPDIVAVTQLQFYVHGAFGHHISYSFTEQITNDNNVYTWHYRNDDVVRFEAGPHHFIEVDYTAGSASAVLTNADGSTRSTIGLSGQVSTLVNANDIQVIGDWTVEPAVSSRDNKLNPVAGRVSIAQQDGLNGNNTYMRISPVDETGTQLGREINGLQAGDHVFWDRAVYTIQSITHRNVGDQQPVGNGIVAQEHYEIVVDRNIDFSHTLANFQYQIRMGRDSAAVTANPGSGTVGLTTVRIGNTNYNINATIGDLNTINDVQAGDPSGDNNLLIWNSTTSSWDYSNQVGEIVSTRIAGPNQFSDSVTYSTPVGINLQTEDGNVTLRAATPTGGSEGEIRLNSDTVVGSGAANHNLTVNGNVEISGTIMSGGVVVGDDVINVVTGTNQSSVLARRTLLTQGFLLVQGTTVNNRIAHLDSEGGFGPAGTEYWWDETAQAWYSASTGGIRIVGF